MISILSDFIFYFKAAVIHTYLCILEALSNDTILNVVFTVRRWSFNKDRWQISHWHCIALTTLLVTMMFGGNAMEATKEEVLPASPQSDPIQH